jgi:hypothetical protein
MTSVGFLRRGDKTLNERLLEEAHLQQQAAEPPIEITGPDPYEYEVGAYWDALVAAEDDDLRGDSHEFATLPDGELIVDESCDDGRFPRARSRSDVFGLPAGTHLG